MQKWVGRSIAVVFSCIGCGLGELIVGVEAGNLKHSRITLLFDECIHQIEKLIIVREFLHGIGMDEEGRFYLRVALE